MAGTTTSCNEMGIDIETYSSVDLMHSGVHAYCGAPDFDILLFGYTFDGKTVDVLDLTARKLPQSIIRALFDTRIIKTAYNAKFELLCLETYLGKTLDVNSWSDTQAIGMYNSYPASLANITKAMGFGADKKKDSRGKALIRFFSVPCTPTKANGFKTRNMPTDYPEKWKEYIEYNRQDVVAEQAVRDKLRGLFPPHFEKEIWNLDREINNNGILPHMPLVKKAIDVNTKLKSQLQGECTAITGIENPNSVIQLRSWVEERLGHEITGLAKEEVSALLDDPKTPADVRRVLTIRQLTGKSSIAKYQKIIDTKAPDGRCHDLFQYYGATRTGRWAGRNIQLQNLPRNSIDNLDEVRAEIIEKPYEELLQKYENLPSIVSQLIRTAFIAPPGSRYIIADFSAIEARVIAWLAGESWRQEAFKNGEDIYCASASQMFHVPVVKHGINGHLRQKGKVAELALGYGGGPHALITMGSRAQGLDDEELPEIVSSWRAASPKIVQMWRNCEKAARYVISGKYPAVKICNGRLRFHINRNIMFIELPSGRHIAYLSPQLAEGHFGHDAITYKGLSEAKKNSYVGGGRWQRIETYGGKITENIVQAVARDCLAVAMLRLQKAGYKIVMHVHDEVICEMPNGEKSLQDAIQIMCAPASWNEGLILNADGFENEYYMKD